jgi:pimeloyl-ACP methyl ester carboxylesterase
VRRQTFRIVRFLLVLYVSAVLVVSAAQNYMIYHPVVAAEPALLASATEKGVSPWRDETGRLIGWRVPNPRARARLLVFHGNSGNALGRDYYLRAFGALAGGAQWEVLVMEYPGYGARAGDARRADFLAAGRDALARLRAADSRPIYLLGESLGSGTACALAAEQGNAVAGVLLVVPLARLSEVASRRMPWLPVGLVLRDEYDNIAAVGKYEGPVAVVVASEDEVVGAEGGRRLHAACAGPKLLIELAGKGHNDLRVAPDEPWVRRVDSFLLP